MRLNRLSVMTTNKNAVTTRHFDAMLIIGVTPLLYYLSICPLSSLYVVIQET
jgi:hypothetical protein